MDSENEYLSNYKDEFQENEIDKFIFNESDYIMDVYYDLKDRIPYFIDQLGFSDLLHFIIDIKFNMYRDNHNYHQPQLDYFEHEYKKEIDSILYVLNNYLRKYNKLQINYNTFLLFSYRFTTIV